MTKFSYMENAEIKGCSSWNPSNITALWYREIPGGIQLGNIMVCSPKTLQTSQHYGTEGFQEMGIQLGNSMPRGMNPSDS